MSIIARPPSALGFVVIFLVILWGLLSQRKLYKILSRAFNISLDGEGSVDSLYTNWDSSRDFITVTFPNRVGFLWHHIWIRFFIFFYQRFNVCFNNPGYVWGHCDPQYLGWFWCPFQGRLGYNYTVWIFYWSNSHDFSFVVINFQTRYTWKVWKSFDNFLNWFFCEVWKKLCIVGILFDFKKFWSYFDSLDFVILAYICG